MENVKYLTIAELFQKLRKNPVNASQFNPNPEAPEIFIGGDDVESFFREKGASATVDVDLFVQLVDQFLPMLEKNTHKAPDWLAENLWRVGYYSELWRVDFSVAVITSLFLLLDMVDERYTEVDTEYLLMIRTRLNAMKEKRAF